jgi:hypothetical protein
VKIPKQQVGWTRAHRAGRPLFWGSREAEIWCGVPLAAAAPGKGGLVPGMAHQLLIGLFKILFYAIDVLVFLMWFQMVI